jgi:hypothetical protein
MYGWGTATDFSDIYHRGSGKKDSSAEAWNNFSPFNSSALTKKPNLYLLKINPANPDFPEILLP